MGHKIARKQRTQDRSYQDDFYRLQSINFFDGGDEACYKHCRKHGKAEKAGWIAQKIRARFIESTGAAKEANSA